METQERSKPFWRQGDIYFVLLDQDARADGVSVKRGVIAKGETTGHSHRLSSTSMSQGAVLSLTAGSMFLCAPRGATIVHDEHDAISLPAGRYAVVHQQEYDGLTWRRVID